MLLLNRFSVLFLASLLLGCSSWLAPEVENRLTQLQSGEYQLDKNHAALIFKIQHLGLSTYVGRFNEFDASLSFDPQNMTSAKLEALVDITSIDVNNDKLANTLQNSTWFDSDSFPQAHFISRKVTPISDEQFIFEGDLTLKGVTNTATFTATFHGGADNWMTGKYTLGFSAKGQLKREDYNMSSYIPLVGNEVDIEIYAEFVK